MTERFSPEYKAFILSDEASVLQKKWQPNVGDWVWTGHEVGLLEGWDTLHLEKNGMELCSVFRHHAWEDGQWSRETFHHYQLRWLPTLTDSLDMIEEAGWEWSRNPGTWHAWKPTPVPGTAEKWASIKDTEDILAAATLAVRVLEGKDI